MPDFERLTRSLEQHLAQTPEEAAFVRGKHVGQDEARKQVVKIVAAVALVTVLIGAYIG